MTPVLLSPFATDDVPPVTVGVVGLIHDQCGLDPPTRKGRLLEQPGMRRCIREKLRAERDSAVSFTDHARGLSEEPLGPLLSGEGLRARNVLGWPKRCKLAHAFLWKYC
jgi:hypothetical protein